MIPEADMSHEEMQRMIDTGHLCAECSNILTIAWGGFYGINSYILRCGTDVKHKGITGHDKEYEKKKKEYFSMESKSLMVMDETAMLKRVEMARFPQDMTAKDKSLLAQVAITYGFDPLMGEVTIYQGRPFVSIDGRYRKAQETGRLDGVESRPATKQERLDWQIEEGDYFLHAEVYVKGSKRPFVGWGRVRASETKAGSTRQGDNTSTYKPIQNNPQRMAEKRAEAQALRKAFHIPLPSAEDIGSPDYDVESTGVMIDGKTGEITEPEAEVKTKPKTEAKVAKPKAEAATLVDEAKRLGAEKEEPTSPIDLDWLRENLGKLQAAKPKLEKWTNREVLAKINIMTGGEARKMSDAVKLLSKEQAAELTAEIEEMLAVL